MRTIITFYANNNYLVFQIATPNTMQAEFKQSWTFTSHKCQQKTDRDETDYGTSTGTL